MDSGTLGGIIGCIGGTLGGVIGSYFAITNTESPAERRFVVRCTVVAWVAITVFLAALFGIKAVAPRGEVLVWLLFYGPVMFFGIRYTNKKCQAIREREQRKRDDAGQGSAPHDG